MPTIYLRSPVTFKESTISIPETGSPDTILKTIEKTLLRLEKARFDYYFSDHSTEMSTDPQRPTVLISRRLHHEGLTSTLFESRKEYQDWFNQMKETYNKKTTQQKIVRWLKSSFESLKPTNKYVTLSLVESTVASPEKDFETLASQSPMTLLETLTGASTRTLPATMPDMLTGVSTMTLPATTVLETLAEESTRTLPARIPETLAGEFSRTIQAPQPIVSSIPFTLFRSQNSTRQETPPSYQY